ncbi:unnamed protein product [Porites lobata]|uniref:DNA-directed DNA polymerase n=1 Tax=Porites lobata TaxID=104759 RepID=A0ABN8RNA2_9CNID|nr:unnamed protein product [Porites lobata]
MKAHVRKFHSEAAKRKASVNDELDRLELLHADKVPRLNVESQTGGAVMTRGTKRKNEEEDSKNNVKESKPDDTDQTLDTTEEYGSGPNPLFVADVKKLGPAKRWKNNAVVNQKFILTLDQQRAAKDHEDLNIAATHAIATATDNLIDELKIPFDYWMTHQIGSRKHRPDRNEKVVNEQVQDQVRKFGITWRRNPNWTGLFYVGRTGMAKCHYEAEEKEKLFYEDFTSLYPTINKYGTYPVGHPQIIVNVASQNIQDYFGIALEDSVIVKDVRIFNEDVMEVSVLKTEDACESRGKINIFIAAFTTALARLKLYAELERLE